MAIKKGIHMGYPFLNLGGRGGIRTLDTEKPYNGFRVRRIRPLCHPSALSRAEHYSEIEELCLLYF